MTLAEALEQANEILLDTIAEQLRRTVADMLDAGLSHDEVNALLPAFISELERFRKDALAQMSRGLSEPDAISTHLH